jgi:hypothetical protein
MVADQSKRKRPRDDAPAAKRQKPDAKGKRPFKAPEKLEKQPVKLLSK